MLKITPLSNFSFRTYICAVVTMRVLSDAFSRLTASEEIWAMSPNKVHGNLKSGWKLHVAGQKDTANKTLETCLEIIKDYENVSMKACKDIETLERLNNGNYGQTQVGKFITIYDWDQSCIVDIAKRLCKKIQWNSGRAPLKEIQLAPFIGARFGVYISENKKDGAGRSLPDMLDIPGLGQIPDNRDEMHNFFLENNLFQNDEIFEPYLSNSVKRLSSRFPECLYDHDMIPLSRLRDGYVSETFVCLSSDSNQPRVAKVSRELCGDSKASIEKMYIALSLASSTGAGPANPKIIKLEHQVIVSYDYIEGQPLFSHWIDYTDGKPLLRLNQKAQSKVIENLARFVDSAALLHDKGITHGDMTPTNALVTSEGRVVFIDYEDSEIAGVEVNEPKIETATKRGTEGYFSEFIASQFTHPCQYDIYAIGAFFLEVFSGISPINFGASLALENADIRIFGSLASIAIKVMGIMKNGINAKEYQVVINDLHSWSKTKGGQNNYNAINFLASNRNKKADATEYISRTDEILMEIIGSADELKCFYSEGDFYTRKKHGSLNTGASGVAYYLSLASLSEMSQISREDAVQVSKKILNSNDFEDNDQVGLHFGSAGIVYGCLCSDYFLGGTSNKKQIDDQIKSLIGNENCGQKIFSGPDITHGIAGKLLLLVQYFKHYKSDWIIQEIKNTAQRLCLLQNSDGSWNNDLFPDENGDLPMLGFAHGITGIMYALSQCSEFIDVMPSLSKGIEYLFSQCEEKENYKEISTDRAIRFNNRSPINMSHWWCHGEIGATLLLIALYKITQEPQLIAHAEAFCRLSCGTRSRVGTLGTCHGLSGLGEVYIDLWQATGRDEWRNEAYSCAECLISLSKESSSTNVFNMQNPIWGSANPSLMTGFLGASHFLNRLYSKVPNVSNAAFPGLI